MADLPGRAVTRATVSQVIIRACAQCGGKREIGKPCETCGLADPPMTHDLGVQSYTHRSAVRRAWWALWGQRAAAWRARKARSYVAPNVIGR